MEKIRYFQDFKKNREIQDIRFIEYTLVLPINISSNNDWELFKNLSIKTLEKFTDSSLKELIIIASKSDIAYMIMYLESSLKIRYIEEESLLNVSPDNDRGNNQKLLKLLVYQKVETCYYIPIDADIYLTQPFDISSFFKDEKIKYNSENLQNNLIHWENSCRVLMHPVEKLCDKKLMSVIPEIFVTKYVESLCNKLVSLCSEKWQQRICDIGFTEFALYWIHLLQTGNDKHYTHEGFPLFKHDLNNNILDLKFSSVQNVINSFKSPVSYFSVIQGHIPLVTKPFIQVGMLMRKDIDAIFLLTLKDSLKCDQTMETICLAKKKIINSISILTVGTKIENEYIEKFNKEFDIVLYMEEDSKEEYRLLEKSIQYLLESDLLIKVRPKILIRIEKNCDKLDNFDYIRYSREKCTFDKDIYSIPVHLINDFYSFLKKPRMN